MTLKLMSEEMRQFKGILRFYLPSLDFFIFYKKYKVLPFFFFILRRIIGELCTHAQLHIVFTEIGGNLFASSSFLSRPFPFSNEAHTPHGPFCCMARENEKEKVFADCVKGKGKKEWTKLVIIFYIP